MAQVDASSKLCLPRTPSLAQYQNRLLVGEFIMGKKKTRKIGRDAKNGQFITVKDAKRRPNTTVVETIKNK